MNKTITPLVIIAVAASSLLATLSAIGVVGFRYPRVIENEPLNDPIEVAGVDGNYLVLADSRVINVPNQTAIRLQKAIMESDFQVEIEGDKSIVVLYARKDGSVCGTPWAQPINIPIFPETVYRNRREIIATGEFVEMASATTP